MEAVGTIGKRIKAVLKWRGISITDAATKIRISRVQLSQWTAGHVKKPDINVLGRFAKLTEVPLDWIVSGEGSPPDMPAEMLASLRPSMPQDALLQTIIARIPQKGPWSVEDRISWLKMMAISFQVAFGDEPEIEISRKNPS